MLKNKTYSILAIIPARGGSKGFPGKNIYPLNGKPLIAYTIESALKSKMITKTIVSSDNDQILEVARKLGANIIRRPDKYATDEASSESVVLNTLEQLKKNGESFDFFILLQPTSPLRDSTDIDNAIQIMIDKGANAIISVINIGIKPFKSFYLNHDGYLEGVHNNSSPNMRRQDLPDAYLANGAIYGVKVDSFIKTKSFLPESTIPFEMDDTKSIDIDSINDILEIEKIFNYRPE